MTRLPAPPESRHRRAINALLPTLRSGSTIAKELGCTRQWVNHIALTQFDRDLGVITDGGRRLFWPEEVQVIKDYYATTPKGKQQNP